jgi:predicted DNA-binding transcriptional regulator AlpA
MTHENKEPLLNEHETAALLNVAVPTLRRWRWSGHGPRFIKIGRAVRYDIDELRAYIERQTRCSTSDPGPGIAPVTVRT